MFRKRALNFFFGSGAPSSRVLPIADYPDGRLSPRDLIHKGYDAALALEIDNLASSRVEALATDAASNGNAKAVTILAKKYPDIVTPAKLSDLMQTMDGSTRDAFARSLLEENASGRIPPSLSSIFSGNPTKGVITVLDASSETTRYLRSRGVLSGSGFTLWVHSGEKYDSSTAVFPGGNRPGL